MNGGSIQDEKDMASKGGSLKELNNEISESSSTDSESETITPLDDVTQHPKIKVDQVGMDNLGQLFERCIQQVSHLEKKREEMIKELLRLQEPMLRVVEHLRRKLEESQRLVSLAQLDYMAVHEEVQQEELKAHIQSMTKEMYHLQEAHQRQLNSLSDQAKKPCRPRAMSDVSQCRQASVRLQRRLSGSVRALEGWYEPRLMALLNRRQLGEEALRKSRERAMDLKASMGPLRDDIQRLEVQRSCLEQKITLMEQERKDSVIQHKETVEKLQETVRELEVEFEVQRKSKKTLEVLKKGLLTELAFLRGCDEPSEGIADEDL
ncbi:syncoilin-like isoform X3 [Channa argus]|uniref:syncoilin-like isoform X3 n=1 Tax=Channa argus TaxID=215402 RepID=UPI0035222A28